MASATGLLGTLCLVLSIFLVRPLGAQDLATIRVSGPPIDAYKAVYYGIRSGLFRRYGLNVEAATVSSGNAALAALAGGSVDVAFTSLLPVAQGHLRGVPFKIVAPAGWYISDQPQLMMLVKKDSSIRNGRDLNGKTIASASLRDLNVAGMLAWIDKNGGDSHSVRVVEIPNSALLAALDEGRIDAAILITPFLDQALASGKTRVLAKAYDAIAKRFETAGLVASADYIAKNQDAMTRFARAMHESIVYTNSHMPQTVDLVASYSGVEAAVIAKSVRATDPEYVEAKNIQPLIDVAAKYGIIEKTFDANEIISEVAVRPAR